MIDKDRIVLQKIVRHALDALDYTRGLKYEDFLLDKKTVAACAFTI